MKILKPGKVEMRKFVCPDCGCVFVADESDLHFTPIEAKIKCPCCWLEQKWMRGEPYEEPTSTLTGKQLSILHSTHRSKADVEASEHACSCAGVNREARCHE